MTETEWVKDRGLALQQACRSAVAGTSAHWTAMNDVATGLPAHYAANVGGQATDAAMGKVWQEFHRLEFGQ